MNRTYNNNWKRECLGSIYICHNVFTLRSLLKELIPSLRSWLWHHRLPNVTTTEARPRLWWHLGVCGVTAMTENEVSISILSWYHKINSELGVFVKPNCLLAAQVYRAVSYLPRCTPSPIAKTIWSISIEHISATFVSDRCFASYITRHHQARHQLVFVSNRLYWNMFESCNLSLTLSVLFTYVLRLDLWTLTP